MVKTRNKGTKIAKTTKKSAPTKRAASVKSAARATAPKRARASKSAAPAAKAAAGKAGQFVYQFGKKTDGNGGMKPLLGGKGANLAEMCRIGLPVPPGFTITTEVCTYF